MANEEQFILTISEMGLENVCSYEYRLTHRGGSGIIATN